MLRPIIITEGNEVALLQAGETGAMIFLSVDKRDTIDLTVNANYERAPTGNAFLGTAYDALFSSFDAAYGSGVEHGVSSSSSVFDEALSGIDMSGKGNSSTAPRAFVNYIFFDQEMNYVRAGFLQITTAAQGIGVHETISLNDIIADRKGYILAYLSNENAEEVAIHWDDFTVYHGKTNVVYATNYYPGGFTFDEYQRTASVENKWKFQSKEWLPKLRVYDFGPRGWDPLTWRTNAQDILANKFPDQSSYSLFRNNPVSFTDPTGMSPVDWVEDRNGNIYWDDNATSQATTKEGETYLGKNVIVGTHNRDATGNEEINTARFDLYLESDKKGSSATIIGNTVPADVTKHGTLAEGLYPARFQGRYSKLKKGIDDLSIIINEGKALPTITGKNPNNPNSDYLTNVFIHAGNKGYERLWYNRKRGDVGYISEGCQTTGCGQGSRRSHNLFMQKVGRDFNGYYFLRSDPNNHKEEN